MAVLTFHQITFVTPAWPVRLSAHTFWPERRATWIVADRCLADAIVLLNLQGADVVSVLPYRLTRGELMPLG